MSEESVRSGIESSENCSEEVKTTKYTVGIVGLGLIGGSFAKAYHEAGHSVLAWNRSRSVLEEAPPREFFHNPRTDRARQFLDTFEFDAVK